MLNRSMVFVAAVTLFASASQAGAGLLGSPMNLKFALASTSTVIKSHAEKRLDACVLHSDDVFAGPVTIRTCGSSI
jgi:hypothetical protein